MSFRKWKGIRQDELTTEHLGTKGPVTGKYERNKMKPSIKVASKMAELLDVSLDCLGGKTDVLLDSKILNLIIAIQKVSPMNKKLSSHGSMLPTRY